MGLEGWENGEVGCGGYNSVITMALTYTYRSITCFHPLLEFFPFKLSVHPKIRNYTERDIIYQNPLYTTCVFQSKTSTQKKGVLKIYFICLFFLSFAKKGKMCIYIIITIAKKWFHV